MKKDDTRSVVADDLDERLSNAVQAAVQRREKVESMSSWWRNIRHENHFRKSLQELFSGD